MKVRTNWSGAGVFGIFAVVLLLAGCRSTGSSSGTSLPVVRPESRALPGSVDSADAPNAPRTATDARGVTTFVDPQHGLRFTYPADWRPLATGGPMNPPAFARTAGAPEGSEAFLAQGTAFANTNLVGLSFSWTTKARMNGDECAALPKKALQTQTSRPEAIGGILYTRVDSSDAAMCHQMTRTIDTAVKNGTCYVFERDRETICPGIKVSGKAVALTADIQAELQRQLDAVMDSVQLH